MALARNKFQIIHTLIIIMELSPIIYNFFLIKSSTKFKYRYIILTSMEQHTSMCILKSTNRMRTSDLANFKRCFLQCCGAGAAWSRSRFFGRSGSGWIFKVSKREKSCSCSKHKVSSVLRDNYDPTKDLH